MISEEESLEISKKFSNVKYAFAYGSGVMKQSGYDYSKSSKELPMIDLILIVEDSLKFHVENLKSNLDHYSSPIIYFQLKKLKHFDELNKQNKLDSSSLAEYNKLINDTARIITKVQENYKANFWFNAYVQINLSSSTNNLGSRLFKYGIISVKDASKDLLGWENMYLAGRMHKPVRILKCDEELKKLVDINLESALKFSLFLLPSQFSEIELFETISSLSYSGDPRMAVGENPDKVSNLVRPSLPYFRDLYRPFLSKLQDENIISWNEKNNSFLKLEDKTGDKNKQSLLSTLPLNLKHTLNIPQSLSAQFIPNPLSLKGKLASVVKKSATSQSLKGLITVSPQRSFTYALAKLAKRFKR